MTTYDYNIDDNIEHPIGQFGTIPTIISKTIVGQNCLFRIN